MRDISEELIYQMIQDKCSPLSAFLTLTKEEKDVRILQSKSAEETSGRLRDKGDMQTNR